MSNFVTLKCQILIMLQHRITTSIILSLGILLSWAQPYCDVRKFSILDGLAANTISDLKQAPDRLMWFGTWNGLSYYDGYTFTTFRDAPNSRDLLSTNRISFIRPNILCDVWVVTIDHKPYIFDTHLCEFVDIGEVIKKELGIDIRVRDVFTLKNGNTWLTSMDNRFVVRITDLPSPNPNAPNSFVKASRDSSVPVCRILRPTVWAESGYSPTAIRLSTDIASTAMWRGDRCAKVARVCFSVRLTVGWPNTTSTTASIPSPCRSG